MMPSPAARLTLLPALEAPVVVVIRRKPSKKFHILRWDTQRDVLTSGSWFTGRIYEQFCDVSPDGRWMVYNASGGAGFWTALAHPPRLTKVIDFTGGPPGVGGGYWSDANTLNVKGSCRSSDELRAIRSNGLPFEIYALDMDRETLPLRMQRDGWTRIEKSVNAECWRVQPTAKHPALLARRTLGYKNYDPHSPEFAYELEEHPGLIDEHVGSACFDTRGSLVFARKGKLHICRRDDLLEGRITNTHDLEPLEPEGTWEALDRG